MLTLRRTNERTALYRQGETAKYEDIANGPKDGARTEANAKALAKKILRHPLTMGVKCQSLSRQNMPKLR